MKKTNLSVARHTRKKKTPEPVYRRIYFRLKKETSKEDRYLFMRKLSEAGAKNVTHSDLVDPIADVTDEIWVRFSGHFWLEEDFEIKPTATIY